MTCHSAFIKEKTNSLHSLHLSSLKIEKYKYYRMHFYAWTLPAARQLKFNQFLDFSISFFFNLQTTNHTTKIEIEMLKRSLKPLARLASASPSSPSSFPSLSSPRFDFKQLFSQLRAEKNRKKEIRRLSSVLFNRRFFFFLLFSPSIRVWRRMREENSATLYILNAYRNEVALFAQELEHR